MKTIIKILSGVILLLTLSSTAIAQQDPSYAQFHFNGLALNPAYSGSHEVMSATLLYRSQWVSIPGAPRTFTLSVDAPVKKYNAGAGILVVSDRVGITKRNSVSAIYSYKLKVKEKGTLSLGLSAGFSFLSTDYSDVEYSYNYQNTDDAFTTDYQDTYPSFGLGIYYSTKKFYAGFSVPSFLSNTTFDNLSDEVSDLNFETMNHYYLTSGYVFTLTDDLKLKPSVLLKYVNGANPQVDVNLTAWLYETFGVGVSYSTLSAFNFYVETKVFKQLFIGYAFSATTSDLNSFEKGSHEIMLRYDFDFAHSRVVTPRYF